MFEPPINVNRILRRQARKLEASLDVLKDTQVLEFADYAEESNITRLRTIVDWLDQTVDELAAIQGGR